MASPIGRPIPRWPLGGGWLGLAAGGRRHGTPAAIRPHAQRLLDGLPARSLLGAIALELPPPPQPQRHDRLWQRIDAENLWPMAGRVGQPGCLPPSRFADAARRWLVDPRPEAEAAPDPEIHRSRPGAVNGSRDGQDALAPPAMR